MSLTRLINLLSMGRSLREGGERNGYTLGAEPAIPHFLGNGQMTLRQPRPARADRDWGEPVRERGKGAASAFGGGLSAEEERRTEASQRRLSLEDVKVVRNDLSETDIEVVARARPAVTGREATFERREVGGWKRLTERLFRSGGVPAQGAPAYESRQRELIARI